MLGVLQDLAGCCPDASSQILTRLYLVASYPDATRYITILIDLARSYPDGFCRILSYLIEPDPFQMDLARTYPDGSCQVFT
jgi:hypothetical protein